MSDLTLRFLTRPGCHICDDARPHVMWAASKAGVGVDEIDIESDDDLLGLYGLRIPVLLTPGGALVAEGVIEDRRALRKRIKSSLVG